MCMKAISLTCTALLLMGLTAGGRDLVTGVALDLDEEQLATARELFPEVLELRRRADEIYRKLYDAQMALGYRKRRRAQRDLSELKDDLEDVLDDLADEFEDLDEDYADALEDLRDEENDLLDEIHERQSRNRNADRYQRELDRMQDKLAAKQRQHDILQMMGLVPYRVNSLDGALVRSFLPRKRFNRGTIKSFLSGHEELIEARLEVEDLKADLQRAEENPEWARERRVTPEEIRARLESKREDLADEAEDLREDINDELDDLLPDQKELEERSRKYLGSSRGQRYEEEYNAVSTRISKLRDRLELINAFANEKSEKNKPSRGKPARAESE